MNVDADVSEGFDIMSTSETQLLALFEDKMLRREVREPSLGEGVVIKWEPLGNSSCDTLVRFKNGREIWCASHTLTPIGNLAAMPLPNRTEVRKAMAVKRKKVLENIQNSLPRDFIKLWPGAEFGKVLVSRAISNAIKDCE